MSSSNLLRFHEVRDAYRLIGECCDLGGDPGLWQPRLLDGARRLAGAEFAAVGEGRLLSDGVQVLSVFDVGLDSNARRMHGEFVRDIGPDGCPIF